MADYVSPVNQFLKSIDIQPYDRYLPNAFNDSLTMLEKVNKIAQQMNESNELTNEMVTKWNEFADWINEEGINEPINEKLTELVNSGTFENLVEQETTQQLTNVNGLIKEIEYNLTSFPRLPGETNDRGRIDRAIATMPIGATLRLPGQPLKLGGSYTIPKRIKLAGRKPMYDPTNNYKLAYGTILDSKIVLGVPGVQYEDFGIEGEFDNAFEINGDVTGTRISRCLTKVKSHGFLMQDAFIPVDDIVIQDCESFGGTHGFISKAKGVKFIRCRARKHLTNGFVFVSDNIENATKPHLCIDNLLQDCIAEECQFGLNMYCRDYHSETNENNVVLKDLTLNGFKAINCDYAYSFGDTSLTNPAGQTLLACENIQGVNLKEEGSKQESFLITRLINSSLLNINVTSKPITWRTANWNKDVQVTYSSKLDNVDATNFISTIGSGSTPTLLSMYQYFKTQNTSARTITNFIGGTSDRVVHLMIDDDFTSLIPNANLNIYRSYKGKGSWVILKYKDGIWYEIAGWTSNKTTTKQAISINIQNRNVDENTFIWDFIFMQNTPYKIGFTLPTITPEREIKVVVRPTVAGTYTWGGFDTTNAIVPDDIPLSLSYEQMLVCEFFWFSSRNKYVCDNWVIR